MFQKNRAEEFVELIEKKLNENSIKFYLHSKLENTAKIVEFKKSENDRTFLALFFLENEPAVSDAVLLPINDYEMYQYLGIFIGSQIKVFLQHKIGNASGVRSCNQGEFQYLIGKPLVFINMEDACEEICKLILSQFR